MGVKINFVHYSTNQYYNVTVNFLFFTQLKTHTVKKQSRDLILSTYVFLQVLFAVNLYVIGRKPLIPIVYRMIDLTKT